jgi:thiol-disulfide isomerase/thioredoxin
MSDESDDLLRTHAAEIASLPAEDPLRALLEGSGCCDAADDSAERLRVELLDVDVPELAPRLLAIPRVPVRRSMLRFVALAAGLLLAFAMGNLLAQREQPPVATATPTLAADASSGARPEPAPSEATPVPGPRVLAVKLWHEHCPICKELDPSYTDVMQRFDESEVLFVTFDMSTQRSRNQAALLASTLGVRDVYDEVFGSSGFVVLIDAQDKRRLGRLTVGQAKDEMTASIREALARTRS